jgi:hypothetical protein
LEQPEKRNLRSLAEYTPADKINNTEIRRKAMLENVFVEAAACNSWQG